MKRFVTGIAATMLLATATPADTFDYTTLRPGGSMKSPGGRNITAFDRTGQRRIGGYFDTEFLSSAGGQTFRAHHLVLEASSQVHERILFNSEIEFEYGGLVNGGGSVDDNGNVVGNGSGEIAIEQAWADFELGENHYLRSGIFVMPFGQLNILHDSDVRDATNRPIYAKYIVPSTWTDAGIGGHGSTDINDVEINYEGYIVNGLGTGISSSNGVRSARPNFEADNNQASAFIGRVGVSPTSGLEIGSSVYTGKYSTDNKDGLTMLGLDTRWKRGAVELQGEYAKVNISGDSSVPSNMNGYYVEGHYHFFPAFLNNTIFKKGYDHPVFTAFARYSAVDLDTSISGSNDKSQITIGMNYRPIGTAAFKIELEINDDKSSNKPANAIYSSVALGF